MIFGVGPHDYDCECPRCESRAFSAVQHSIDKYRPCLERLAKDDAGESAEPAKPRFSERYGHCITGDPAHINPHLEQCDCTNWQSLSEGAQESMNAREFWGEYEKREQVGGDDELRLLTKTRVFHFAEAYAAERVASAEKQLELATALAADNEQECNEEYERAEAAEKQVEALKKALQKIVDLEVKEFREPMDYVRVVDKIAERALDEAVDVPEEVWEGLNGRMPRFL